MRELATRHALGASLFRLTRHLLTETVCLTLIGGAAGLAIGYGLLTALGSVGFDALPRANQIHMHGEAITFTFALALVVGPSLDLRRSRGFLRSIWRRRSETKDGTCTRGEVPAPCDGCWWPVRLRSRSCSWSAQAFCARASSVLAVDPGFNPSNLLTARVTPPPSRYKDDASLRAFADRFVTAVRAVPGVQYAGVASSIPFGEDFDDSVIIAEGYQMAPGESLISTDPVHRHARIF